MNNFTLLIPEFLVTGLAFLILTADLFMRSNRKHLLAYLAVLGLIGILAFSFVFLWNRDDSLYEGVILIDGYSLFFKGFFLILGMVVILSSVEFVKRNLDHPGEYYGILVFTIVAMMLMAMSGELLTAYISLELLSFGLYVLVSYDRYNPKSNEGGTKYILLGAFSTGLSEGVGKIQLSRILVEDQLLVLQRSEHLLAVFERQGEFFGQLPAFGIAVGQQILQEQRFGHGAGDAGLLEVLGRLRNEIRAGLAARRCRRRRCGEEFFKGGCCGGGSAHGLLLFIQLCSVARVWEFRIARVSRTLPHSSGDSAMYDLDRVQGQEGALSGAGGRQTVPSVS